MSTLSHNKTSFKFLWACARVSKRALSCLWHQYCYGFWFPYLTKYSLINHHYKGKCCKMLNTYFLSVTNTPKWNFVFFKVIHSVQQSLVWSWRFLMLIYVLKYLKEVRFSLTLRSKVMTKYVHSDSSMLVSLGNLANQIRTCDYDEKLWWST